MLKINRLTFIFIMIANLVSAQLLPELPRHAYWGASFTAPTEKRAGAIVRSIDKDGFAEQVGLITGDIILKVNSITLSDARTFEEMLNTARVIKGGTAVTLEIIREGQIIEKKGTVPSRPKESFPGIITEYRSILSPFGYRVQVIITRPENVRGKIPGIFVTRWMSCDPVEKPVSRKHGVAQLLEDFITKSGYAVMRVEKTGLGDSEGPPCADADFTHELLAHQQAYKAFKSLDYIDASKIIVFAQSNGMAYAPLVVDQSPAAFVVSGGWAKTWFEHILEFKRRAFESAGDAPEEVGRKMRLITELYTDYLVRKQIPGEIIKQKPYLKEVWDGGYDKQWGLPTSYFQQLQELDVTAAWGKVNVPTYVFYGGFDFAMVQEDHIKIVKLVNKHTANLAHYEYIPNMHHSMFWFENEKDAASDFWGKGKYQGELTEKLIKWMHRITL